MNSDDEHSESEFYYPTEDFAFAVPKRNKFSGTINAMENQTSITLPEEACKIQSFIESQRPDNTTKKTTYDINVIKRYFKSIKDLKCIPFANVFFLECLK